MSVCPHCWSEVRSGLHRQTSCGKPAVLWLDARSTGSGAIAASGSEEGTSRKEPAMGLPESVCELLRSGADHGLACAQLRLKELSKN